MYVKEITKNISIEGNVYSAVLYFYSEIEDRENLRQLWKQWVDLAEGMIKFGSRAPNLPEGISEVAFSLEYEKNFGRKAPRVKNVVGASHSFDTFDMTKNRRQQIKARSSKTDSPSSFGPKSVWDDFYFVDFSRQDGSFDVYKIPNNLITGYQLSKTQTFKMQQKQTRRPRFRITGDLITPNELKPIATWHV